MLQQEKPSRFGFHLFLQYNALVIAAVVLKKQDAVEEALTGNSQPLIGLESSSELRLFHFI